jgi:hypothetical protein
MGKEWESARLMVERYFGTLIAKEHLPAVQLERAETEERKKLTKERKDGDILRAALKPISTFFSRGS